MRAFFPQAKHIPYRDSKLTRILQESLGGNSRTTLIINCSPSSYNDSETLSTLRFGIRAKSIKNTARVNAELSPFELKALLSKANAANSSYQKYIAALEAELAIWRAGGQVDQIDWASSEKTGAQASAAPKKSTTSPTPSATRSQTPVNPLLQDLRNDLDSRPQTPTVVGLDKDEREEFLKRENELSDQLADRESSLKAAEKLVSELKEELSFLKEQETSLSTENKSMSGQLNELRLQVERLNYDNKESIITIDILKEQNQDAKGELEEFKKTIADLKAAQKDTSTEDKEKRKQEKMALMMAKFDAVSIRVPYLFGPAAIAPSSDLRFCASDQHSKAPSPRRTNNFARSSQSSMPSTRTTPSPLSPTRTSCPSGDAWPTRRLSSGRQSTAFARCRKRMRCTSAGATSSSLVSLVLRPSTRSSSVRARFHYDIGTF